MFRQGGESQFGYRIAISIQTLQQRLNISESEMQSYYWALNKANFMDIDDENDPQEFELTCKLRGTHNDAFTTLKEFLKDDKEVGRVLMDCDFSVLD